MTNGFSWSAPFRYSFLGVLALTLRAQEAFVILVSVATDFLQGVFRLEAKSVKRIDAKSVMCKDFEPLLLAAPLCPVSSIFGMLPNGLQVTVLG